MFLSLDDRHEAAILLKSSVRAMAQNTESGTLAGLVRILSYCALAASALALRSAAVVPDCGKKREKTGWIKDRNRI
jgi:hypothetical protein